jgi:SLOG family YspA-like protein
MTILVCGSRSWTDAGLIVRVLIDAADPSAHGDEVVVVHGDARGADRMAAQAAEAIGCRVVAHPADWLKHGRAAGPIRNRDMLDTHPVELVIAFTDDPPGTKGSGTWDLIGQALARGIPVRVYAHGVT